MISEWKILLKIFAGEKWFTKHVNCLFAHVLPYYVVNNDEYLVWNLQTRNILKMRDSKSKNMKMTS